MSSSNKYNPARPKRPGDLFTRTHHLEGGEPSTKKPRFDPRNPSTLVPDAEEEDPILDADEIGKGAGIKRNAVNIDGYDSDSSTENFDARADAKAKAKEAPTKDDDDDDMFAESDKEEEEEVTRRGDKKKPAVRFLEDHEIEGQEDASKSGGHVAVDLNSNGRMETDDVESSSDESGGDEERDKMDPDLDEEIGAGGKKKHAPKLDAFNMRAEQEDGRFDEAGNYVRKAYDPDAAQDAWLDGLSKKDIKKAREAHEKREAAQKERERLEDSITLGEVLSTMIEHLQLGETPMEALARLGKAMPKKKKNFNRNKKAMDVDSEVDPAQDAEEQKIKASIDAITESASRLTDRGVDDVYEVPRELIMRQYKRETGEDWKNPNPPQWEFHWLAAPEGEINGPYSVETMRAWQESGQFEAGAEFRRVGEEEFSRLLDLDD
ncbi:hypothetical protein BU24DRAFT_425184 [Aaosphaeria arxii CBS 175.79]|uniref:GYF domain-containing protein n=1 Tax=Aaosphaeria arxii CBS 175.79 TaxID=1450172 RepID=A0A6A5XJR2_9PLEO|nr:uncharacterized protein BU24DRAFT_425184 [Aaosphaeria arxii CBS 175.79]KAF2012544.1 hypothetical protein BU24DRAFT_425184 [Aaosphaeria arxii CBS 175.79]